MPKENNDNFIILEGTEEHISLSFLGKKIPEEGTPLQLVLHKKDLQDNGRVRIEITLKSF